jgi:hypothetical protein
MPHMMVQLIQLFQVVEQVELFNIKQQVDGVLQIHQQLMFLQQLFQFKL